MQTHRLIALSLVLALAACVGEPDDHAKAAPEPERVTTSSDDVTLDDVTNDAAGLEEAHLALLRDIATTYSEWGKVDEFPHWAPELCMRPPGPIGRMSQSRGGSPHGRKLYYLYARDRMAYRQGPTEAVGQTVVKEAWKPLEVDATGQEVELYFPPTPKRPLARKDGKAFAAGESAGLFVMTRVEAGTPGTDDGWIYATFPPGSIEPESSGKIESCMDCHVRGIQDGRLFGLDDPDHRYDFPSYTEPTPPEPGTDEALKVRITNIGKLYREWGRIDEPAKWSPLDCRIPSPGVARISESRDEETHGRKLYYLYARYRDAYNAGGPESLGQIVVKEAWTPELSKQAGGVLALDGETGLPLTYEKDGQRYEPGDPAGLYVMIKLDPKTPNTDEGWVYATIPPGADEPNAFGRIESCMECHVREGKGRLFGVK